MKNIILAILSFWSILQCLTCAQETNLVSGSEYVIGTDVGIGDITDFYYTVENINLDAYYQRYRFYKENGEYFFFHETREKPDDYGPTTEKDRTAIGTYPLSREEWETFFSYVKDGTVREKTWEEETITGDCGPWTYLFWKEDQQFRDQVFDFASYGKLVDFEGYCAELARNTGKTAAADRDIADMTEFSYIDTYLANDDSGQRRNYYFEYRFYTENGGYYFYHETRKGLYAYDIPTKEDVIDVGTHPLSREEWETFRSWLEVGWVRKPSWRDEISVVSKLPRGMHLYWGEDHSEYQIFSISDPETRAEFTAYCAELALKTEETDN